MRTAPVCLETRRCNPTAEDGKKAPLPCAPLTCTPLRRRITPVALTVKYSGSTLVRAATTRSYGRKRTDPLALREWMPGGGGGEGSVLSPLLCSPVAALLCGAAPRLAPFSPPPPRLPPICLPALLLHFPSPSPAPTCCSRRTSLLSPGRTWRRTRRRARRSRCQG